MHLVLEYLRGDAAAADRLQIFGGVAHAHRYRIRHRGVKPENLMFTEDGDVNITDFSLAQVEDRGTVTMAGTRFGTLAYLAREWLEELQPDLRSDVFRWARCRRDGPGQEPFPGDNSVALLYVIAQRASTPRPKWRPHPPEWFEGVLLQWAWTRYRSTSLHQAPGVWSAFRTEVATGGAFYE